MPFDVNRKSEICKRNNDRPGCCWYLCDNPKKSLCKNCYSCYSNCPHGVYEIINDEPQPVHQENYLMNTEESGQIIPCWKLKENP